MRYVPFGQTGIDVSVLGFGCGPMGSRFGERESLRALGAAFESGITTFDTARAYGHGDAERILGKFIRDKRDRVVISTKFGLQSGSSSAAKRALRAMARRVLRVVPRARALATPRARSTLGAQLSRSTFSAPEMRASVERSLAELRTDYIDVLFLHSPPAEVCDDDLLFAALDGLVRDGKVRCVGVAASAATIEFMLARRGQLRAVQFHQNLLAQSDAGIVCAADPMRRVGTMAHQPFGGPDGIERMRAALKAAASDDGMPGQLREKLEMRDTELLADVCLNGVIRNTGVNVAVCAMYNVGHIRANAAAVSASRFNDEEIALLQARFRSRVPEMAGR